MDLDTIKQHYITLLFTFFITLNAFSQVEGQSFCDGLEEGEYFPLNIVKKKVYWYNTYYFETKEGTKIIDGKKYNVFNQRWEDGSSDTILFREDSGGVYQYTENGDILRYNENLTEENSWTTSDGNKYTIFSYNAELETPYCRYTNLLEMKAMLYGEVYIFYYQKGYGYVGCKKDDRLISFVSPEF